MFSPRSVLQQPIDTLEVLPQTCEWQASRLLLRPRHTAQELRERRAVEHHARNRAGFVRKCVDVSCSRTNMRWTQVGRARSSKRSVNALPSRPMLRRSLPPAPADRSFTISERGIVPGSGVAFHYAGLEPPSHGPSIEVGNNPVFQPQSPLLLSLVEVQQDRAESSTPIPCTAGLEAGTPSERQFR